MQFDRGYLSSYFVTDAEKGEIVLEDVLILLYEKKLNSLKDLLPLLEQVMQRNRPLLIVAEDVEAEALATLVLNKLRGVISCVAVKAPGYGDRRRDMLQDVAILTGGKLLSEELGVSLGKITLDELGQTRRVVVNKDSTTIIGGLGAKEQIQGRVNEIRRQIEETTSEYDRDKLRERLAKLSGGVAVIRVGAPSEAEMKNLKEAFEDAISAAKAAIAEGVVPGGGLALLRVIDAIESQEDLCQGDERTGFRMLVHALEVPTRQIAENSGIDAGVVVDRMRRSAGNIGFDASTGQYVDLMETGIIDATKVVRIALENAVSVASVLLLSEATLTLYPEPKAEKQREFEPVE
jgi:chaperonin GroEL